MGNDDKLKQLLLDAGRELGLDLKESDVVLQRTKDPAFGDYASNLAMRFAKSLGKNPRDFAGEIIAKVQDPIIVKAEVAGPGFINFFLRADAMSTVLKEIFEKGDDFGKASPNGKRINIEYVSANPTGDLHLGHTRCAAVGDTVANVLSAAGYDVTREYYVNDCGNQVEHLGSSIRARFHQLFGEEVTFDKDDYLGEDLIAIAQAIKDEHGDKFLVDSQESHDFFIRFGIDAELAKIKKDLSDFRVHFDRFSYESDMRRSGAVEKALEELKEKGFVYEDEGATYLRTSAKLDDKDRPIVKSNGQYTYFMPDIGYHYEKIGRGYDLLIDILGADHHGYINRMKSALMMKGYSADSLEVELVQIVRVYRDGVEVKMSKRTGKAIAHRDLVEDVGVDAVRYFFVERSPSTHLDFNYNLATEQSSNNPVFYAQYAHARCCSLLTLGQDIEIDASGANLGNEQETAILKHLASYPGAILDAARDRAPYRICGYVHDLAGLVHEFYAHNRVIDRDNLPLTSSRLALVKAAKIVLRNALAILGVSSPTKM